MKQLFINSIVIPIVVTAIGIGMILDIARMQVNC